MFKDSDIEKGVEIFGKNGKRYKILNRDGDHVVYSVDGELSFAPRRMEVFKMVDLAEQISPNNNT